MSGSELARTLDDLAERCRAMDAPLAQRLDAFATEARRIAPAFATLIDRLVARLQDNDAGRNAPSPGEPMPPFLLPDETGRLWSLAELQQEGSVLVSFQRGHWCPYCRLSVDALVQIAPDVARAGGRIVAITPELQAFTRQLKADARAPFPVLSDIDCGYALELNLAIHIDDELRDAMTRAGREISVFQGNASWMLPIPAIFVVGADGLVKARFLDPDYRRRAAVEGILAALG